METKVDSLHRVLGKIQSAKKQLTFFDRQKEDIVLKIESSKKRTILVERSSQVLKNLMNVMASRGIKALEKLIEQALNIIFNDREYEVELFVDDKRGVKTLDFFLIEEVNGVKIRSDIKTSVGGSVVTIVSLITQMFYIHNQGGIPVLFIDEAFADISKEYLETLFSLLTLFKQKMGFDFFIITHMNEVLPYADHLYELNNGIVKKVK